MSRRTRNALRLIVVLSVSVLAIVAEILVLIYVVVGFSHGVVVSFK